LLSISVQGGTGSYSSSPVGEKDFDEARRFGAVVKTVHVEVESVVAEVPEGSDRGEFGRGRTRRECWEK
jgi:hypothetical protein